MDKIEETYILPCSFTQDLPTPITEQNEPDNTDEVTIDSDPLTTVLSVEKDISKSKSLITNSLKCDFTCASCNYKSFNDKDLLKHFKTKHKSDLSCFCKRCDKCFSTIDILIAHIKTNSCQCREINYRCSIQNCNFESNVGYEFERHFRIDHKHNLFIPCLYCEKAFTLPHCLILHMEDDCPFSNYSTKYSHSDTPLPTNIESSADTIDVVEEHSFEQDTVLKSILISKNTKPSETIEAGEYTCPCCNYFTVSHEVLHDHYISEHKHISKNDCLVCKMSYETVEDFLQHFSLHGEADGIENVPEVEEKHEDSTEVDNFHEKTIKNPLLLQTKLKSFHDLKSYLPLHVMKKKPKLNHFFKCSIANCQFTTDDSTFYADHLTSEHYGRLIRCNFCLIEFRDAKTLVDHILKNHGHRIYQCCFCFYRGPSMENMELHFVHHHPERKTKVEESSQHLIQTDITSNNVDHEADLPITKLFVCILDKCNFRTYNSQEFLDHHKTSHKTQTMRCYYCQQLLSTTKCIIQHYLQHDIKKFQCRYCTFGSNKKVNVVNHMEWFHSNRQATFNCSLDDKTIVPDKAERILDSNFNDSVVKKPALDSVSPKMSYPTEIQQIEKLLFCRLGFCGKLFADIVSYMRHLIDDHVSANYPCPYCFAVRDTGWEFVQHLWCHGPRLYACTKTNCYYYSCMESYVSAHMNSLKHTDALLEIVRKNDVLPDIVLTFSKNSIPKNPNLGNFLCPFCNYKCPSFRIMKNHMYIELAYRRFYCNLCETKCVSRDEITRHFTSEHFDKYIVCTMATNTEIECLVRLYLSGFLRRDMKLHKELNSRKIHRKCAIQCCNCNFTVLSIQELQHHVTTCLYREYERFFCSHCGIKVSSLLDLRHHSLFVHDQLIDYCVIPDVQVEKHCNQKLQAFQVAFLKDLVSCMKPKVPDISKIVPKYYQCSYCQGVDDFRRNIEIHHEHYHHGLLYFDKERKVLSPNDPCQKINLFDVPNDPNDTNCYFCGFCSAQRFLSRASLDEHYRKIHPSLYVPALVQQKCVDDTDLKRKTGDTCSENEESEYLSEHDLNDASESFVEKHQKANDGDCIVVRSYVKFLTADKTNDC